MGEGVIKDRGRDLGRHTVMGGVPSRRAAGRSGHPPHRSGSSAGFHRIAAGNSRSACWRRATLPPATANRARRLLRSAPGSIGEPCQVITVAGQNTSDARPITAAAVPAAIPRASRNAPPTSPASGSARDSRRSHSPPKSADTPQPSHARRVIGRHPARLPSKWQ